MPVVLLQAAAQGVLMGGVYALIAGGLTLIFGVMRLINFAHGEFLMLAMYATYVFVSATGWEPYWGVLVITPLMCGVGMAVYRWLIRPVLHADHIMQAQLTLGLLLAMQSLAQTIFRSDERTVPSRWGELKLYLGPVILRQSVVLAFLIAVLVSAALYWVLQHTDLGRAIRATAQDYDAAGLMGIHVDRIHCIVFGVGIATLGIAGVMLAPFYYISPFVGSHLTFLAFVIVVLGGMGHYLGALAGGLVIGLAESLSSVLLSPHLAPAITYGLFVLILLFRPSGLFGGAAR